MELEYQPQSIKITQEVTTKIRKAGARRLLLDTLRAAETEAKTRYLTPWRSNPISDYCCLRPVSFGRHSARSSGKQEDFDSVSGGTQEQITVPTHLAFAELLTEKGRSATLMLDDALAFSDDDRIEGMFGILM